MNQFIIHAYYHLINCIIRTSFLQHHSNLSQCHCFFFLFLMMDGKMRIGALLQILRLFYSIVLPLDGHEVVWKLLLNVL